MLADGRTAKSLSRVQINTGDNCLKVFLSWDASFVCETFPPFVLMFIFFFISIFVSFSCVVLGTNYLFGLLVGLLGRLVGNLSVGWFLGRLVGCLVGCLVC